MPGLSDYVRSFKHPHRQYLFRVTNACFRLLFIPFRRGIVRCAPQMHVFVPSLRPFVSSLSVSRHESMFSSPLYGLSSRHCSFHAANTCSRPLFTAFRLVIVRFTPRIHVLVPSLRPFVSSLSVSRREYMFSSPLYGLSRHDDLLRAACTCWGQALSTKRASFVWFSRLLRPSALSMT